MTIETLSDFSRFAKTVETIVPSALNCVIYTRVSTREQALHNMSLETQLKACEMYASKYGLTVCGSFGGTYESAKNDERLHFKKMLAFVKSNKQKISSIIVYSVDRFSRSGANAIYIASELKKQGVSVIAVTQPADTNTASGRLQQHILFIFSEYDNELRRDKAVTGMREKVLRGGFIGRRPLGYDSIVSNGEKKLVPNEDADMIRKAFEWKATEGLTNEQILDRFCNYDFHTSKQTLSEILRNPFYCGVLTHKFLDGKVIEGRHEKIISKELFLKVNEILQENHHDYKHAKESEPHPLRRFVKCGRCGTSFAGYVVQKKGIHYYKCAKKGCRCNRNAQGMHKLFVSLLQEFCLDERLITPLQYQWEATVQEFEENNVEQKIALQGQLTGLQKKIETFEERYGLGEIAKDIFDKFTSRYKAERDLLQQTLKGMQIPASNLSDYLERALRFASKIQKVWELGSYSVREKLQYLIFPEGIIYEREINRFRTVKTNLVFEQIRSFSKSLEGYKTEPTRISASRSNKVGAIGFEPMTPCL